MVPLLSAEAAGLIRGEFPGRCIGCGATTDWYNHVYQQCQRCSSIIAFRAAVLVAYQRQVKIQTASDNAYTYSIQNGMFPQQAYQQPPKRKSLPKIPQPEFLASGPHIDEINGIYFCCPLCSMETAKCDKSLQTCWGFSDAPQVERILAFPVARRKAVARSWHMPYETPCGCNKCQGPG